MGVVAAPVREPEPHAMPDLPPDAERDVCVFASSFFLTVSIEQTGDGGQDDELHFHPGGQGFWVARMLRHLGAAPVLVAPVGGESGDVLRGLTPSWGVHLLPVETNHDSPAYVHDRRSGEREQIAKSPIPALDRHELDDIYGRVLEVAGAAGLCVVTGRYPGDRWPLRFYERLGADLKAVGARAVGDLHGDELDAFLKGGPLHTLKMSDEEIASHAPDATSVEARLEVMRKYQKRGVERAVASSADGPTVLVTRDGAYRASAPTLKAADHRGSGDSMTAALAYAALKGMDEPETLRLACAAGAANVTRHGLGNADVDLVRTLAKRVEVEKI